MATKDDPCVLLEHKVRMRLHDDESHRRIAEAMTEIALAAIHPARHLGVGRTGPEGMFEDPIQSATETAVEALVERLEDLVETFPRQTIDRLMDEQRMADHGIE